MKKTLARLLILSFFITGSLFLKPSPRAQAQMVTMDPTNLIPNILGYGEDIYSNIIVTVLEVAVKKLADKVLNKLVQDTLSWANGGFDGEPGFINNWDDFLKGTVYEVIGSALTQATTVADNAMQGAGGDDTSAQCTAQWESYNRQIADCQAEADPLSCEESILKPFYELPCEGGDPGGTAQQNYNIWQSGTLQTTRAVAGTIASAGAKRLNYDPLTAVINGEGETLSKLLGSQQQKDAFKSNFAAGGIAGYIALADPHNSSIGQQGLVEQFLGSKTQDKVTKTVQDIQAPQKYLGKTECSDGSKPVLGACPEGERKTTTTPGDIVGDQVRTSLGTDKTKASMANGLVDSLVKAVGALTDGLLDAGVSGLTDAAGKAFFNKGDSTSQFADAGASGSYQSGYDVLGISADVGFDEEGNPLPDSTTSGPNNSDLFVGGPEHLTGEYGTKPQITVSFEADLEKNIDFLIDEQKYYEDVRRILAGSLNILYEFDKCIPGADMNWEERYKDSMPLTGNESNDDEDVNISHKIGFNEQKNMLQDPKVTIPGGVTLMNQHRNVLNIAKDGSVKNKFRLDQINSALAALQFIKQSVLENFNQQKLAYNAPLVLFMSDWKETTYSNQDKIKALQAAEAAGYFLFPSSSDSGVMTDQQAQAALVADETKVMNAVIKMSWEIWRTETDANQKLDLRKSFYVTRTQFSSEDLVASAKIKADQINQSIVNSYGLALDCMVFKMYALGISRDYIAGIVFDPNMEIEDKVLQSAAVINQYDPLDVGTTINSKGKVIQIIGAISGGGPVIGEIGAWLFGGGKNKLNEAYFNVDNALSNESILSFLESEWELKQQNLPSVFTTGNMISPEAIKISILGFESIAARNKYFNLYYPEISGIELPEDGGSVGGGGPFSSGDPVTTNKFNIKEMYRVDRVYAAGNRLQDGMRGFLFCRTPGYFEVVNNRGDDNDKKGSRCYKSYYSASKLDYKLLIAGINN